MANKKIIDYTEGVTEYGDLVYLTKDPTGTPLDRKVPVENLIPAAMLLGYKNKLINGRFDLWQRGTSTTSLNIYLADRWRHLFQQQ